MSDVSSIEWTDSTWNPITGCTKLSAGCDNCYAERFAERFRGVNGHPFETGFDLTLRPERVDQPRSWKRPRMIFVNSMSDLFHKQIPTGYVDRVFDTMERADWHVYQVLTKRSSIMRNYVNRRYRDRPAPAHIWLGVSIENTKTLARLKHLHSTNATTTFVSFEPLLGPVGQVDLTGIDWVIAGGESGPKARPVEADWIREIRDQCHRDGAAFFFKQWGGRTPKSGGNDLDGRQWLDYPTVLNDYSIDEDRKVAAGATDTTQDMFGEVGPWAKDKLQLLGKYLHAYTTIMRKQPWCRAYCYIDAFAGFGRNRIRGVDTGQTTLFDPAIKEFIDGSPRVALDLEHPFSKYVFVEKDTARVHSLQTLKDEYSDRDIRIYEGDANDYLEELCGKRGVAWNELRAVVFLDPYGSQVKWSTIEAIARIRSIEIIINFPLGMCIQRLLPRHREPHPAASRRLDDIFGTHEWYDVVYSQETSPCLFGESVTQTIKRKGPVLLDWYTGRLKSLFEFVTSPHLVRTSGGQHLYYLIHVGNNRTGHKIAAAEISKL